jgi:hypothetical protein
VPDQRVQVRVWADEGPGRAPEQRAGVLKKPLPQTAVCVSGGGTRSMAATVGQLRGLVELGLLDGVGYLSCVSGSAWAVVPYLYAPDGAERLGAITRPEALTLSGLDRVEPRSLLESATHRFRDTFHALDVDGSVLPDQVWTRAVGATFLAPVGLYDHTAPFEFGPASGSVALATGPRSSPSPRCHRPRVARPFPVVHATLNWPESRSGAQQKLPFEYTPLYVGSPQRRVLDDQQAGPRTVGGTFVEPVAFGSAVPEAGVDADGRVVVQPPRRPFTLGDMIGASSAFSTPDRDVSAYPHARYWSLPAPDRGPCMVNDLFTDGGDVDNLALLGMLRRRVPSIVVFLNSVWPLALDHDVRHWPDSGQIDPAVPPLFGQPSQRWPHNQVFSPAAYPEVVSALQAAKRVGRPLVASTRLMVEPNEWWGIDGGWEVSVCWVYNDRVPVWEAGLPDTVRRMLDSATENPDASLARFPHYLTVGQNAGALTRLTPLQANLLAELAGWGVLESEDTLRGALA